MDISYNWLKEYIKIDKSPEEVAELLTSLGLEIGSITEYESVKGGLEGIITGEVLSCKKHPNADKLSVTTVDTGNGEPVQIVCGAPNVAAGQKVVVAPVGSTLYPDNKPFPIKKVKIRGEHSLGMICAEDEIGTGKSHDGIIVLPDNVKPGTPVKELFKIERDTILEVDLTPNRIDGASHIGVARDLAAALSLSNPDTKTEWPSVNSFKPDNNNYPVKVTVEDTKACPRYSSLTISDVKVEESPQWLKTRLTSLGMTPINNIVDITNFVLHECGQPLHAFDGDQIKGDHVIVKTADKGEKFITLDEEERELHDDDLMINNEKEGMCIAGVFGGIKSGVTQKTTKLFLESACFNPVYIRQTSRRHALFTDASFRFERGTDPNITIYALKRAALLIKEIAGGTISSQIDDIYPVKAEDFKTTLKWKNITRLTGKEIDRELIKKILTALEIKITDENQEFLKVAIPPYRVDVQREADVIEEILRVYGYNNIETPLKVNSTIVYSNKPDNHKLRNIVAAQLTGAGFTEIMCNSLTKGAYYSKSEQFKDTNSVMLANPLSADLNTMRQTLFYGGLETIKHNSNRQNPNLKLFEQGNCYYLKEDGDKGVQKSYIEKEKLALFITGETVPQNHTSQALKSSFYDIKSHSENILIRLGIEPSKTDIKCCKYENMTNALHYSYKNSSLMTLGSVSKKVLKEFDIDQPVYFAEIEWETLINLTKKSNILYSELSRFPEVTRDLSLLLNKSVQFKDIEKTAYKAEKKLLKNISLFDIYEGEKLGEGKKSYAVTFTLQDSSKTLNDKQIDKIMQKLIKALEKELNAQLRS
ncbi:phenylalanine--tRNA ligase subunit beta [Marinilabiliaceae bacterium ANBcel2]|nr:phenylalanine--tRNA ligase subunit beta [Marinilabiliaceae bacterium ANBcel2]